MIPNRSERFLVQNRGLGYVARNRDARSELASIFINPEFSNGVGGRLNPGPLIIAPIPDLIVPLILEGWI